MTPQFDKIYNEMLGGTDHPSVPDVLWHATYRPLLRKIMTKGLGATRRTNWSDSKPGVVYLAMDPDSAESYAETAENVPEGWLDMIVVLKVDTKSLDKSGFSVDTNNQAGDTFEFHGVIPPEHLSVER